MIAKFSSLRSTGFKLGVGLPAMAAAAVMLVGTATAQEFAPHDQPQPPAFDVPLTKIPTTRINAQGEVDLTASPEDVQAGAKKLMDDLGLVRNFEVLHWIPAWPDSAKDEATGQYSGGGLDGAGEMRALMISGKCLFGGFNNSRGDRPALIWRIADDPVKDAPTLVGEIPQPPGTDGQPQGEQDDTIILANLFTKADGTDSIVVARAISTKQGGLWTYEVNPADCSVTKGAEPVVFSVGDIRSIHEASLWVDPKNPMRHLVVSTAWDSSGLPDAVREGAVNPDLRVFAITDETSGDLLPRPVELAHFTLQDIGGPLLGERPNEDGIFLREGRYPDYSNLKDRDGDPINPEQDQNNASHQAQFGPEGDRIYVAYGTAGAIILDSSAIANNTNEALAAQNAGCNWESTNVWADGVQGTQVDLTKVKEVSNDCIHPVFLNEPGVQSVIDQGDIVSYLALAQRARFDPFPANLNATGTHSFNIIPGRFSLDKGHENRPAYAIMTSERSSCPGSFMWMVDIEVEAFPYPISGFGLNQNELENCLANDPTVQPDGTTKRSALALMNHNPTVFKNIMFVTWYAHGLRAIDISNPFDMREVGHVVTAPAGVARSFPVVQDGLVYWSDNKTGIHVARYIGPYADELPHDGKVYMGSQTFPTR